MSVITALRSLRTTPGPVLAAVLTLALAAGVNLAMFGLIDRALLSAPAGVANADRLFTLGFQPPGDPASVGRMTTTSYVMFTEIRDGDVARGVARDAAPSALSIEIGSECAAAQSITGDQEARGGAVR